jgi:thiol:disulfide interchange protein DsbC
MKKIVKERKDIVFYIKLYPLPMHKEAHAKAKAIVCEKSMSLLEDAFERKTLPAPKCETTVIDDNVKLAQKLGITGTPAIIMPDGRLIPGYLEADALIKQIENK